MKIMHHNFLIISAIAIIIGGVCLYSSNDSNSDKLIPVALGSSLSDSTGGELLPVGSSNGDKISSDISFLASLISLKKIKIDTTLFTNKSFNKLKDNSVKIEQVQAGRVNPFAPIDMNKSSNVTSVPSIITNQPTQITNKTAVLNGTINNIVNSSVSTYFEYGTTMNLGTVTETVGQSLVGTFVKNILGLTSKTTYFFKACLKINNIPSCGEVLSFITN